MKIQVLIRDMIEEQLVEEDKWNALKKTNLSRFQRGEVYGLFEKKPHLEKEIDWNKYKTLTWEKDFLPLFELGSMGKEFKKLKKNRDYLEVIDKSLKDVPGLLGVYVPFNYKTAQVLAKKAGNSKASWCIGYDDKDDYWYGYTYGEYIASQEIECAYGDYDDSVFYIFIFNNDKFAVQVHMVNDYRVLIWDKDDKSHGETSDIIPNINVSQFVNSHKKLSKELHTELKTIRDSDSEFDDFYNRVEELQDPPAEYEDGSVINIGSPTTDQQSILKLPSDKLYDDLTDITVTIDSVVEYGGTKTYYFNVEMNLNTDLLKQDIELLWGIPRIFEQTTIETITDYEQKLSNAERSVKWYPDDDEEKENLQKALEEYELVKSIGKPVYKKDGKIYEVRYDDIIGVTNFDLFGGSETDFAQGRITSVDGYKVSFDIEYQANAEYMLFDTYV